MAIKYAATDLEKNEAAIRRSILDLWNITTNKTYGEVLRACAEAGISGASTPKEKSAERGYEFVKGLLNTIDVMKTNLNEIDFKTLRAKLKEIIASIEEQIEPGVKGSVDFPDVTNLIFFLVPARNKHEAENFKKTQYGKVRTGLTRIHSMAKSMLSQLNKFEGLPSAEDPTKAYRHHQQPRLVPQRAPLSVYDIVPFIRQYGIEYGIRGEKDWEIAFRDDPEFKEEITTVINAVNRGKIPNNEQAVKMEIARVIRNHEARMATNQRAFEMGEDEFKQTYKAPFVSPELKKERLQQQRQVEEARIEEQEKLQEQVRQRDEAHQRQQQDKTEQEILQEEEALHSKYSSSRLEQILKRYQ